MCAAYTAQPHFSSPSDLNNILLTEMVMELLNIKFTSVSLLFHSTFTLVIWTPFAEVFNIRLSFNRAAQISSVA